ncbi:MAG: hypothetical protein HYR64_05855 [Fimbriimonas ginsengisoli]|uniref:Uncharacterized protein n=1 Tax=Fimbriimonas ginsengisoli TaxID=1005039 RepID=A0A931PVU1_FIMGI|nr:hypothetical protein [Fimbriimonas ginsengisoli]
MINSRPLLAVGGSVAVLASIVAIAFWAKRRQAPSASEEVREEPSETAPPPTEEKQKHDRRHAHNGRAVKA